MAWIYLQELVGSHAPSENGSSQWLIANQTDMHSLCCCQECQIDGYPELLSGMTLHRLAGPCYHVEFTSLQADSHAKISVLRELEKAWKESEAGFISRSKGSSKKSDRLSFFSKTCQRLELEEPNEFAKDWPASGMIAGGTLYPLPRSERHILEKDGSCWPTPVANDDNKSPRAHMAMKARMKGGARKKCTSLNVMVKGVETGLWPTPNARDHFPPHKPEYIAAKKAQGHGMSILTDAVNGQLNPTWVEWLMGYPLGWTELKPWAMQWFHNKPKQHSKD